jgi:cbb3-type cytochrome oxidase subunit 3
MMKDVVRAFQNITLGEIGLIAFVAAFVLVVIYALTMSRARRQDAKNQPLDDGDEFVIEEVQPYEEEIHR